MQSNLVLRNPVVEEEKNPKKGANKKAKDNKPKPKEKLSKNAKQEEMFEKPVVPEKVITERKQKKAKKDKQDPLDKFDPLHFKPTVSTEAKGTEETKADLAKYEYKCSACPYGSDSQEVFKAHFKCDWHKYNCQRKVAVYSF